MCLFGLADGSTGSGSGNVNGNANGWDACRTKLLLRDPTLMSGRHSLCRRAGGECRVTRYFFSITVVPKLFLIYMQEKFGDLSVL